MQIMVLILKICCCFFSAKQFYIELTYRETKLHYNSIQKIVVESGNQSSLSFFSLALFSLRIKFDKPLNLFKSCRIVFLIVLGSSSVYKPQQKVF